MGKGQKGTGYSIEIDREARDDLKRLPPTMRNRVANKIEWLALYADELSHEGLSNLPLHLKGLKKRREGDWRILYWLYHQERKLKVYAIMHRSANYNLLIR